MNYYRRYIGDYGRDTTSLSLAEHGAYALLLDAYYADEHPLPAKVDMLYRICRATTNVEKAAVRSVADKFFPIGPDGQRHNARADRELGKAKTAIEQMSEAGKKGAASRWGSDAGGDGGPHGVGHAESHAIHGGGDGGGNASTNHQPPTTIPQPPTTSHHPTASAAAERRAAAELRTARNKLTRQAFSEAYRRRWGVDPTWDAQANSMLSKFVEKVGIEDAPLVAAFYTQHPRQDYVRSKHDVSLLLRDARGLRTEWATDRRVTDSEARQEDASASRGEQSHRFLRAAK